MFYFELHKINMMYSINQACHQEVDKMSRLAQSIADSLPSKDPRLHHMLVYLAANDIKSQMIIKRVLLDPFVQMSNLTKDEK